MIFPILVGRELGQLRKASERVSAILGWVDHKLYWVEQPVSLWCAAQQIHHLLLVNEHCYGNILKLYRGEDPGIVAKGRPNAPGTAVMTFGKIPRGRAKAPDAVQSPPEVTRLEVDSVRQRERKLYEEVADRQDYLLSLKGRLPHPVLGVFDAPQWLRFARVHAEHHLEIAEEIGQAYERKMK